MKLRYAFFLVFVLYLCGCAFEAFAQCPVSIEHAQAHGLVATGHEYDPWGSFLNVKFANRSDKVMTAFRFQVAYRTALNAEYIAPMIYDGYGKLKPGKKIQAAWGDGVFVQQVPASARVVSLRIVFEDGTETTVTDSTCLTAVK